MCMVKVAITWSTRNGNYMSGHTIIYNKTVCSLRGVVMLEPTHTKHL